MASKKRERDPQVVFLEQCRLYLGGITARTALHAYFGVAQNTVVIANSTSARTHGDRLTDFAVGEIGIHVLKITNTTFWETLSGLLEVQTGVIQYVNLANFFKILSKYKVSGLETFINNRGERVLVSKGKEKITRDDVIGFNITDFHIAREIVRWYEDITYVGCEEHRKKFPHLETDMPRELMMYGKVYFLDVDFSKFKDSEGNQVFTHVHEKMRIMGVDGLTSVSLQSFIKKIVTDFIFKSYWWVIANNYVVMMSLYKDENAVIRSFRPYVVAMPLDSDIELTDNTTMTENEKDETKHV